MEDRLSGVDAQTRAAIFNAEQEGYARGASENSRRLKSNIRALEAENRRLLALLEECHNKPRLRAANQGSTT